MKEKLLLIDAWNLMIGQNAAVNIVDYNSNPVGMYLTTLNQIKNFVFKFKPSRVFFILDGPEAGERRRKLYPEYKNKRRVTARKSKVIFKDEDEKVSYEVDGAFETQLSKIYNFLKLLPVTVCIIPYCEGDDVITYIAKKNQTNFDSIIISTDKDYQQLINDSISVYNWKTKILYDKNTFIETFQLLPVNYIYMKLVMGDTSDNISKTKGIGKKTFPEIFGNLKEKELNEIGDFFDYIDNYPLETIPKKHHKHLTLLKESKKDLLLKFKLMKLDEDGLKLHHINLLKQQVEEQQNKVLSKILLMAQMQKDSFNKLSTGYFNVDNWLQPFKFLRVKEISL